MKSATTTIINSMLASQRSVSNDKIENLFFYCNEFSKEMLHYKVCLFSTTGFDESKQYSSILALDIDQTVYDETESQKYNQTVLLHEKQLCKLLCLAKSQNIMLVLVTGRSFHVDAELSNHYSSIKSIIRGLDYTVDFVICTNGGLKTNALTYLTKYLTADSREKAENRVCLVDDNLFYLMRPYELGFIPVIATPAGDHLQHLQSFIENRTAANEKIRETFMNDSLLLIKNALKAAPNVHQLTVKHYQEKFTLYTDYYITACLFFSSHLWAPIVAHSLYESKYQAVVSDLSQLSTPTEIAEKNDEKKEEVSTYTVTNSRQTR